MLSVVETPRKEIYSRLTWDQRDIAEREAAAIRRSGAEIARNLLEIGRSLHTVKQQLPHGEWGNWLAEEFDWSESQARNYMRVYDRFGKSANFADLKFAQSALYLLAAPSTPDDAIEEAMEIAEEGYEVTHKMAKEIVGRHKEQPAEPAPEPETKALCDCGQQAVYVDKPTSKTGYCDKCKYAQGYFSVNDWRVDFETKVYKKVSKSNIQLEGWHFAELLRKAEYIDGQRESISILPPTCVLKWPRLPTSASTNDGYIYASMLGTGLETKHYPPDQAEDCCKEMYALCYSDGEEDGEESHVVASSFAEETGAVEIIEKPRNQGYQPTAKELEQVRNIARQHNVDIRLAENSHGGYYEIWEIYKDGQRIEQTNCIAVMVEKIPAALARHEQEQQRIAKIQEEQEIRSLIETIQSCEFVAKLGYRLQNLAIERKGELRKRLLEQHSLKMSDLDIEYSTPADDYCTHWLDFFMYEEV